MSLWESLSANVTYIMPSLRLWLSWHQQVTCTHPAHILLAAVCAPSHACVSAACAKDWVNFSGGTPAKSLTEDTLVHYVDWYREDLQVSAHTAGQAGTCSREMRAAHSTFALVVSRAFWVCVCVCQPLFYYYDDLSELVLGSAFRERIARNAAAHRVRLHNYMQNVHQPYVREGWKKLFDSFDK
jgi:hypothetical protein